MADTKISNLNSLAVADDTDLFAIVDMLAFPIETKKITLANLKASILPLASIIENTLLNVLIVLGDFTIEGDSSMSIINMTTTASNRIIQSVTVNSNGELIILSSATLEVS